MMRATASSYLPLLACSLAAACAPGPRATVAAAPANPSCVADFDSMVANVRRDYAGYPDKVPGHEREFEALTRRTRAQAASSTDAFACRETLSGWVSWFGDHHLQVWDPSEPPPELPTPPTMARAPQRLEVTYPDDSTSVLRVPDFGTSARSPIDSLVAAHHDRITSRPYLVIDLRGNGGGWTESYGRILPLVYTGPVAREGMDVWASPGNLALARQMAVSEQAPAAIRTQGRVVAERMEGHLGTFVPFAEGDTLRLDTVFPMPRAVAVLVNRGCASTCEQFVLDAMQGRKVTVMGTSSTRGMLDYGNARRVPLPSGQRRFQMPISRSRRLPARPLDRTGLTPQVAIPAGEPDPVAFAARWLRSGGRDR
jgi:hypothetical protein